MNGYRFQLAILFSALLLAACESQEPIQQMTWEYVKSLSEIQTYQCETTGTSHGGKQIRFSIKIIDMGGIVKGREFPYFENLRINRQGIECVSHIKYAPKGGMIVEVMKCVGLDSKGDLCFALEKRKHDQHVVHSGVSLSPLKLHVEGKAIDLQSVEKVILTLRVHENDNPSNY
jgi:hypothetical protein